MTEKERLQARDLGLDYESAAHGVQTAIGHDMNDPSHKATEPKHMRTGIDMSKSDMLGLVSLLIDKGVFTAEDYLEYMRLAANSELTMREDEFKARHPGAKMSFR